MSIKERAVITSLKVLPQKYMSHVAGVLMSTRLPAPVAKRAVKAFFSMYRVNFDEVREPIETFPSLQSFFVRELKDGARPIDPAHDAFVSPCDGAWGASGIVEQGMALQVKGRPYSVGALLGDESLGSAFDGGTFATLYLSPRDYHRFHTPCAGDVVEARHVPGALWPVNNAGIVHVDGLFAKNERIVAMVRPDATHTQDPNARLALIAVGATMVGKVHVDFDAELTTNVKKAKGGQHKRYDPPKHIDKGAQWGRFEFGSTIVVVATKGWLALDGQPAGTPLVLGTRIGTMR
jgi:phosphatidylserine decarboxylase